MKITQLKVSKYKKLNGLKLNVTYNGVIIANITYVGDDKND